MMASPRAAPQDFLKEGERYFALLKVNTLNFEDPEKSKHKVRSHGYAALGERGGRFVDFR
jgi:hypothetical protein